MNLSILAIKGKNKHMNYAIYVHLKNMSNQLLRKVSDLHGTETWEKYLQ